MRTHPRRRLSLRQIVLSLLPALAVPFSLVAFRAGAQTMPPLTKLSRIPASHVN